MFRYLQGAARVPGLLYAILLPLRLRPLRRLPIAFGLLTKHGIDRDLGDAWLATFLADRAVRRVMAKVLSGSAGATSSRRPSG